MRRHLQKQNQAQNLSEYVIVLGLVTAVFFALGPLFRRGTQAVIKLTADQIGNQVNAEQRVTPRSGYLESLYTTTRSAQNNNTNESLGVLTYTYGESEGASSDSMVNLGFTNRYE